MTSLSKKDKRLNLVLNSIHEYFWGFGLAFHSIYAIVPLFLKSLGAPDAVTISVAGLFSILVATPQFLTTILLKFKIIKNKKSSIILKLILLKIVFF